MNSILAYVVDLKKQVSLLITRYENVVHENDILRDERGGLLKKIEVLEMEIKELRERVEIVDVAQGISVKNSDSVSFARGRVSNLIRQIDKCIALLNE